MTSSIHELPEGMAKSGCPPLIIAKDVEGYVTTYSDLLRSWNADTKAYIKRECADA